MIVDEMDKREFLGLGWVDWMLKFHFTKVSDFLEKLYKAIVLLTIAVCVSGCDQKDDDSIIILSWAGYDEVDFVKLLSDKSGVKSFKFIKYTTGEEMLRKFSQNQQNIDIVIVDAEYGNILYQQGKLRSIELKQSVKATIEREYFPRFRSSEDNPCYDNVSESYYCLVARWGSVGMAYDQSLAGEVAAKGYDILTNSHKIILFDWYLPNLAVFSTHRLQLEDKNQIFDISTVELTRDVQPFLQSIRNNVVSFQPNLSLVIDSFYNGKAEIVPGVGEWVIGNRSVKECEQGKDQQSKDWAVPKNGGLLWIEAVAIPKNTRTKNKQSLDRVIQAFVSAEVQASLAWRAAYASQVPNEEAYKNADFMSDCKRKVLKYVNSSHDENSVHAILSPQRTVFRKVPERYRDWTEIWAKFKLMN